MTAFMVFVGVFSTLVSTLLFWRRASLGKKWCPPILVLGWFFSLCIYPLYTFLGLIIPIGFLLLRKSSHGRDEPRGFIRVLTVFGITCAWYYVLFRFIIPHLSPTLRFSMLQQDYNFSFDPAIWHRLRFFIHELLFPSFSLWFANFEMGVGVCVGIFILFVVAALSKILELRKLGSSEPWVWLLKAVFAGLLVLVSSAPFIFSHSMQTTLRHLFPLMACTTLILFCSLTQALRLVFRRPIQNLQLAAAGLLFLTAVTTSIVTTHREVSNLGFELAFLKEGLSRAIQSPEALIKLSIVRPEDAFKSYLEGQRTKWELGKGMLQGHPEHALQVVKALLRERFILPQKRTTRVVDCGFNVNCAKSVSFVPRLLGERLFVVTQSHHRPLNHDSTIIDMNQLSEHFSLGTAVNKSFSSLMGLFLRS